MYPIRNLAIILLAFEGFSFSAANAADIYRPSPPPPSYKDYPVEAPLPSWAGVYIGINGGYGVSENKQLADPFIPFGGISPSGGFGGGQIGYNWQGFGSPNIVVGIETDIQGSDISEKRFDATDAFYRSNLDYFGTVRGRLGYAFDRTLFYATGGFAYGGLNKRTNDGGFDFKYDDVATGYVVGGGLEYKFSPAWSIKAEYQYLNFGKNDPVDAVAGSYANFTGVGKDDDYHTARLGLNYRLGGDSSPLK